MKTKTTDSKNKTQICVGIAIAILGLTTYTTTVTAEVCIPCFTSVEYDQQACWDADHRECGSNQLTRGSETSSGFKLISGCYALNGGFFRDYCNGVKTGSCP